MTTDLSLTGALQSLGPCADTSAATTYTDLNGLAALPKPIRRRPSDQRRGQSGRGPVPANDVEEHARRQHGDELDGNEMGVYRTCSTSRWRSHQQHEDLGIGAY